MPPPSHDLFLRASQLFPGGVHSPVRSFRGLGEPPVFFKRAEGPYLFSVDGERKIDFCMSFGPLILGHRDPEVQDAVLGIINTAWTFGTAEPYSLALAEWLQAEVPWLEKMRFVSSGTEAVMSALRVARAATGRAKLLKFDGCYHGHAEAMLVKAGSGLAGEGGASSKGIPLGVVGDTLVAPLDDETALAEIFSRHGSEIAAAIIEPLPANYGLLPQRLEFLSCLERLCRKAGSVLIFDEVISGFRVGPGGMAGITGVRPDLVTYGKVIGGGFPVGCYGGKADLMDLVAPAGPVYQAGTLSANPVGMVAGLATLKKMKRVDGWALLEKRAAYFSGKIRPALLDAGLDLVREKSLFWITPRRGRPVRSTAELPGSLADRFRPFFLQSLRGGVYLSPNAYEVGFLSLAHSEEVLDEAALVLTKAARYETGP